MVTKLVAIKRLTLTQIYTNVNGDIALWSPAQCSLIYREKEYVDI